MIIAASGSIGKAVPSPCSLEGAAAPFIAVENIFPLFERKPEKLFSPLSPGFLRHHLDEFCRTRFFFFTIFFEFFCLSTSLATMDSAEILRMNRMLEVEELAFRQQLEEAVSIYLYFSFFLPSLPIFPTTS